MHDASTFITPAPRVRRHDRRPRSLPERSALVLLLVVFFALPALGTDRLVSTLGTDSGNCDVSPCRTLQYALDKIGSTGISGTIKLAQGTYVENAFRTPSGTPDITVQGGWRQDFSVRDLDPALTVIDGSGGIGAALSLCVPTSTVTIEGLTIRSGDASGLLLANCFGGQPDFVVDSVVIRLSEAAVGGSGGGFQLWTTNSYGGTKTIGLQLRNSIVADNTSANLGGGVALRAGTDTRISAVFINVTISHNSAAFGGGGLAIVNAGGGGSAPTVNLNVYNSILWGNTSTSNANDLYSNVTATTVLAYSSDIGQIDVGGGSYTDFLTSNVNVNPAFVNPAAGNYHLQSSSPLVDTGQCDHYIDVEGGYLRFATYVDFEGDPRPSAVNTQGCDIGADEVVLFANGFESGDTSAWSAVAP